jgi:hypothetical protein
MRAAPGFQAFCMHLLNWFSACQNIQNRFRMSVSGGSERFRDFAGPEGSRIIKKKII